MLKISDYKHPIDEYTHNFTEDEKNKLSKCFNEIEKHIKENYFKLNTKGIIKVLLQKYAPQNEESYLVIDINVGQMYLLHTDFSSEQMKYFNFSTDDTGRYRYTLCMILVENWQEIKGILNDYFKNAKSVSDLCKNFTI